MRTDGEGGASCLRPSCLRDSWAPARNGRCVDSANDGRPGERDGDLEVVLIANPMSWMTLRVCLAAQRTAPRRKHRACRHHPQTEADAPYVEAERQDPGAGIKRALAMLKKSGPPARQRRRWSTPSAGPRPAEDGKKTHEPEIETGGRLHRRSLGVDLSAVSARRLSSRRRSSGASVGRCGLS